MYLLQALLDYAFISHQGCLAPITGRVDKITHPVIICRFSLFLSFSTQVTSQKKKKVRKITYKANLKSTFKKTIWKSIKIIYVYVGQFTFLYSSSKWHSGLKQLYSNWKNKASKFSFWDPPLYLLLSLLTDVNRVFSISANVWLNFQRGKQKNIAVSTFIYHSYETHMCYKCPQTVLSGTSITYRKVVKQIVHSMPQSSLMLQTIF